MVCGFVSGMAAVETVGGFGYAVVDDGQGGLGCVGEGDGQSLFLLGGEGGQHPICQVVIRVGLGADPDFDPGKL